MAVWNNCPACGCMVEATAPRCPVCGTPIPRPRKQAQAVAVAIGPAVTQEEKAALLEELNLLLQAAIMTPNEARALYGLPPV